MKAPRAATQRRHVAEQKLGNQPTIRAGSPKKPKAGAEDNLRVANNTPVELRASFRASRNMSFHLPGIVPFGNLNALVFMSFESVKAILDTRQFAALIGLDEDTWLEAKGRNPYDFATPAGRYELAKDITAFANAEGGIVLVGLTTTLAADAQTERITAHDLCPQGDFDAPQYLGIIKEHIYPRIRDLKIYWLPVNDEGTHGLGVIEVPPQSPNQKYFLIAKVVDSGTELKQIVFGIAKRNDSSNDPFTIAELYKYTQSGKHPVPQTLARVEAKLDAFIEAQARPTVPTRTPNEVYNERTARILDDDSV